MKWSWPSLLTDSKLRNDLTDSKDDEPSIWIFGYGSLIWNPGFEYVEARKGHMKGYSRKFYQGNTTYRGSETLPGRVATIVPDPGHSTVGMSYRISGLEQISNALDHLHFREVQSGYAYKIVRVHLDEPLSRTFTSSDSESEGSNSSDEDSDSDSYEIRKSQTIMALTYVATRENEWFLGPKSHEQMAREISDAYGKAGPCSDYLLNLAKSVRSLFPGHIDSHLFELESLVLKNIGAR